MQIEQVIAGRNVRVHVDESGQQGAPLRIDHGPRRLAGRAGGIDGADAAMIDVDILLRAQHRMLGIEYPRILDEHRLSQLVPIALGNVALVCGLRLQLLLLETGRLRFPALQNQLREAGKDCGERSLPVRCHPHIARFQIRAAHGVQGNGLRFLAVRHGGIDQFDNGQFAARNARQL